jgi:hypothetical protein
MEVGGTFASLLTRPVVTYKPRSRSATCPSWEMENRKSCVNDEKVPEFVREVCHP